MASVLVVCGLNREAAIAAGDRILTIAGGGSRTRLESALRAVDPGTVEAVVSFGLAGALTEMLEVGDIVCPETVTGPDGGRYPCAAALRERWNSGLAGHPPHGGALLGVAAPVLTAAEKRRLGEATGALALDMESHIAAAYAAAHGLPFGVLRAISDASDRTLPPVAASAMRPDGSVDLGGVLWALAKDPGQIPALIRTARDAGRAFRALGRVRGLLGSGLGLHL